MLLVDREVGVFEVVDVVAVSCDAGEAEGVGFVDIFDQVEAPAVAAQASENQGEAVIGRGKIPGWRLHDMVGLYEGPALAIALNEEGFRVDPEEAGDRERTMHDRGPFFEGFQGHVEVDLGPGIGLGGGRHATNVQKGSGKRKDVGLVYR